MDVASQNQMSVSIYEESKSTLKPAGRKRLCNPAYLWIAGLLILCLEICPVRFGKTIGDSMSPTLMPNQIFLMYRCFGHNYTPSKNDVVVFRYDGEVMVKRVLATPGESVWIVKSPDGNSVVDPVDIPSWVSILHRFPYLGKLQKLNMGPDEMFVLGDNIAASCDSRDFGPIKANMVLGRVRAPDKEPYPTYNVAYAKSNIPVPQAF
jgi:signal peptidase I